MDETSFVHPPAGRVRAIALVSGGLDSLLAWWLLAGQGVEVVPLHFANGFDWPGHRKRIATLDNSAEIRVVDMAEQFFRQVLLRPKHGYGSAMNPCLDCRIFMLRTAATIADRCGADLVATGEVLGQSVMTQRRRSLDLVEAESGLKGRLLRPLSALHLSPTDSERAGRIRRDRLGGLEGRSRKHAMRMAQAAGLSWYPAPGSGCCMLADRGFSTKLRDLVEHSAEQPPSSAALARLRIGRHFRLSHAVKLVVARDEDENRRLRELAGGDWVGQVVSGRGAVVLAEGSLAEETLQEAAAYAVRYSAERDRNGV
jgi:tRNA(Ile)-lysidine synthase TilS/MesJ